MGNPTESTYRRLFTIAKYIRLYHNSKIYQNEYNNISKYQTISLYQNISASKINITIMGTISEIYHVSCEWVKNREAEVHRAKYKGCGKVVESSTQQWVQLPEIYHGSHFHNN